MIGSILIAIFGYGMAAMCATCALGSIRNSEIKTAWASVTLAIVFAGLTFSLVN